MYPASNKLRVQAGVSLIELVLAIVVVATAGTAILSATANITGHGAQPLLRYQSLLIARSHMAQVQQAVRALHTCEPLTAHCTQARAWFDQLNKGPLTVASSVPGYVVLYQLNGQVAGASKLTITVSDPSHASLQLTAYLPLREGA
jgi:MSHA pilin protein MshD